MTCSRHIAPQWLAACMAAVCVLSSHRAMAEPPSEAWQPALGAAVDPDAPTTYRLPVVGIFDPPQERIAMRTNAAKPGAAATCHPDRSEGPSTRQSEILHSAQNDTNATSPYPPTTAELTNQLLPAVQRGYNLAQRGAFFAARTEFVQVLRRVAQAKDAASGTDEHARALAAGLRALDEANDFVPQGAQLEAELDVRTVASSHRTPVLVDYPEEVMPQEAVDLYHSYAQQQLANAAATEQAGSMALYGLGKVYARLAERRDDDVQLTRSAMTMYSAALATCPDNHMAANELGVLMCRTGHPEKAVKRFERTIDLAPSATAYHNLAIAQQKLGIQGPAAANEQEAQRLATLERSVGAVSKRAGIQWVSPAEMARVSQQPATPAPAMPEQPAPTTASRATVTNRSIWR
jgi:tetratricopeptide (TPR) repeat protein